MLDSSQESGRNKRRWKRFQVPNGAVVTISRPSLLKLGKSVQVTLGPIKDIGMKGLAVQYVETKKLLDNVKSMSIMVPGKGVVVENLRFRTVADFEVAHLSNSKSIRTLCVSFDKLMPMQKVKLERFIDDCAAAAGQT